jgi:membrane protease YdiL (CAAX protease family)
MHSNPHQAALGFCVGFFLAYFTIKTGSIITAMIAHSAVNLNAGIPGIMERAGAGDHAINTFYYIWMLILLIAGAYIFARAVGKGIVKFPQYNEFHKKRTLPVMIRSIPIILILIFYLYDMGQSIERISAETAESALEAARKFLLMC